MWTWVRRGLVGLVGLLLLAVAGLYGVSEAMIRQKVEMPIVPVQAATVPGAVARGQHLAQLYGCNGCHEANLQGAKWAESFMDGRLYVANLTRAMPRYSDAQLARAIRTGVRADGSQLWAMPSESWVAVTDAEMSDLLAFLRTHPPAGPETPPMTFGPKTRLRIILGEVEPTPKWVAEARAKPALDVGPAFMRGRHLAQTVCAECHGSDLKGREGETPDLMIGAAYDMADFTRLMRTGVAADGKEKGLMTEVARGRFSHFTDQDIADLHAYLAARSERTPAI